MSEGTKHTPGPWEWQGRYLFSGRAHVIWYTTADDGIHCAQTDARLIAAAPELYEALRLAQQIIGHPDDAHSKLIAAAIAKATGAQP